ncbi:MAG: Ig-like domain-containing protein [Prevotella sp.]|nr:Ig-like domain-containing protein [Prevotella sp.]
MSTKHLNILAFALVAAIMSCARMGQPDGGWYDDTPPRVIYTSPADKSTGARGNKVIIAFDEFIKLEDAYNKVIISPPQIEPPDIKAAGKRIIVTLKDTLKDNTTYTIDFSDAISDNNEGNPMGSYTYSFSTGERIDTFEVAGNVLNAADHEPVKGMLVGLYDDLSDTAFTTRPMIRVSRTDGSGRFVIKGVAPGTYRIYALQDADGDYVYSQKSEMLAFSHTTFEPSCKPDIRQDTVWRDSLRIDSIIRVPYTHYYPDNITLMAFTAPQTDRYLLKTERADHRKIGMFFTAGSDTLPGVRGLNFDSSNAFVVETSEKRDTLYYWLRDTALINRDTLEMELTYMMTDSTGLLVNNVDTIRAIPKMSYEKRQKEYEREFEKWQKEQEKAKKKGEPYDSVMPVPTLIPAIQIPPGMAPDKKITFEMPVPLARCDTAAVHLYSKIDTLWYRSRFELRPVNGRLRSYELIAEWRPGTEYSLEIDSAAFEDIYGTVSVPIKKGIRVLSNDDFGTLLVNVSGTSDTTLTVELLNSSGNVVKQARVIDGTAEFYYIAEGKYYLRAFADDNGNGVWDTGDYHADRQPEAVYYNPKEIECKAKWDITRDWNIGSVPLVSQKPRAIVKQKADKEKKLRNRNADRAAKLGRPYPGANTAK